MRLEGIDEIPVNDKLKKLKANSHEACNWHTKYWKEQATKMTAGVKGNCKPITSEKKHEKS